MKETLEITKRYLHCEETTDNITMPLLPSLRRVTRQSLLTTLLLVAVILSGFGVLSSNKFWIFVSNILGTKANANSDLTCENCNSERISFLIENDDLCAGKAPFLLIVVLSHAIKC